MSNYIIHNGTLMSEELYHHGVKGMKWGHRKAQREEYRDAKKTRKKAFKEYRKANRTAIGIKGINKSQNAASNYKEAMGNEVAAKAKYKAAKSKNSDRAEFNTYRKEMQKSGLAGSAKDARMGGRSTAIYNKIKVEKGKAYADKVAKKVQNRAVAQLATAAVVTVGSMAVSGYIASRTY